MRMPQDQPGNLMEVVKVFDAMLNELRNPRSLGNSAMTVMCFFRIGLLCTKTPTFFLLRPGDRAVVREARRDLL